VSDILLVTSRGYSQRLASYLSQVGYIISMAAGYRFLPAAQRVDHLSGSPSSQWLTSHWLKTGHILSGWRPIGHKLGIFSVSDILLVKNRVYSLCLASYWSQAEYILSAWHPIGHTSGIFSVSGILLVTSRVYSQCLASYWSQVGYILRVWHPIGHKQGIFAVAGILLVTSRVHAQCRTPYRSAQVFRCK
jgi:hypothetical protein